MNRYTRQMVLPQVGRDGQDRIEAAHVLVVGAGGLGVPVLQYLAGAGIGAITLIDPDRVEESNLHRQPAYRMKDIGRYKVRAAARAIARLNPWIELLALPDRLTPANAPKLVGRADVVLDCADSYAVSYTLSDACMAAGKPLISASVLGVSGYVGGFCGGAPSLRALFPDPPDSGQTCATAGVLGPVVGMLGCLQAQMALATNYFTGRGVPRDYARAFAWYKKAAEAGDGPSQYIVASYYERGEPGVVAQNIEQAKAWYGRAAAQGDVGALAKLRELVEKTYRAKHGDPPTAAARPSM